MKGDFSMDSVDNYLWVQKYRPKKLEDLKLPEDYRKDFQKFIINKEIPHLLLYGPPGSGKSTISEILCSRNGIINYPDDNVLEINGSAQGSRGIGFVDSTIEPFLKHPPAGNDNIRIVFIDEGDSLCFDGDVEVLVIENGKVISKKIQDLVDYENISVLSVNLDSNTVEIDVANYIDSGYADMYEVELEDGSILNCSKNHPFFIMDQYGNLIEKKLEELSENDEIASVG